MTNQLTSKDKSKIAELTHQAVSRYHTDPAHACAFYALIGQATIANLADLDYQPVFGSVMAGRPLLEFNVYGEAGFHVWLQNGTEIVDLAARHYPVKALARPYLWGTAIELRQFHAVTFIPNPIPGISIRLLHQMRVKKKEQIKAMLDYVEQNSYT